MERSTAIVTGGNRGVGEGICHVLASKGYDIFMAHYQECDKAAKLAKELKERYSVKVVSFDCNQRDPDIGEQLMKRALAEFQEISLVMCNAGVGLEKYMHLIHPEEIDFVYEVNFRGSLLIANAAAKYMMQEGVKGTILFTSSIRSKTPTPMDAIYGGLKAVPHNQWHVSMAGMVSAFPLFLRAVCAFIRRGMRTGTTAKKFREFRCVSAATATISDTQRHFWRPQRPNSLRASTSLWTAASVVGKTTGLKRMNIRPAMDEALMLSTARRKTEEKNDLLRGE